MVTESSSAKDSNAAGLFPGFRAKVRQAPRRTRMLTLMYFAEVEHGLILNFSLTADAKH